MPDEPVKRELDRLENLNPEARARVAAALKEAIEREVVVGGVGGPLAAGNIFSRGWIFSRLTPTAVDAALIRELPELSRLTAEEFNTFATRLSELKARTSGQR